MDAIVRQHALPSPTPQRQALAFAAHFVEMVLAMFVGMAVVGFIDSAFLRSIGLGSVRSDALVDMTFMVGEMVVGMTAWMTVRGHGRREIGRMAGAMALPGVALTAVAFAGVTSPTAAETVSHPVMLLAMLGVMALDRDAYAAHDGHASRSG